VSIVIDENLKEIIKRSVREVIKEERLGLYEILVPYASNKEISEIKQKFGSPENYSKEDFIDMTNWIKE
jgi:hypothetical protein